MGPWTGFSLGYRAYEDHEHGDGVLCCRGSDRANLIRDRLGYLDPECARREVAKHA